MSRKQKECGLGRSLKNRLEKKRFVGTGEKAPIFFQETEQNDAQVKKAKMKSIIQQNSLSEFLQVAEMSQQDFHANRNIRFAEIREEVSSKRIIASNSNKPKFVHAKAKNHLLIGCQVPRRPQWKDIKGKGQLDKLENQAYLTWRRKLAHIEETNDELSITPYEKNIEVWRQLWRVVERVDILVQIVDGRNPLFFYSEDLVSYAREWGKQKFLVVVNKSDLLEEEMRLKWNTYFNQQNINHVFFTAKETALVENDEVVGLNTQTVLSPHQLITIFQNYVKVEEPKKQEEIIKQADKQQKVENEKHPKKEQKKGVQIGLVGYPNVGKSSVINAVLGKKKVGVASMPGKTKHFQTLKLTQTVTLCDCPGLVFPKISESKAEMILNGLYPIDTVKQFEQPVEMIAYRVAKEKMENIYSIQWKIDEPYDGESILVKYAKLRGYYTGAGLPCQARAARQILKDYVNGVVIYNHPPPFSQEQQMSFEQRQTQLEQQKMNFQKKQEKVEQNLDDDFFQKQEIEVKTIEDIVNGLAEDDFLDIVQGKRVDGMKITKEMRKEIKFCMKRGAKIEQLRKQLLVQGGIDHKVLIKN